MYILARPWKLQYFLEFLPLVPMLYVLTPHLHLPRRPHLVGEGKEHSPSSVTPLCCIFCQELSSKGSALGLFLLYTSGCSQPLPMCRQVPWLQSPMLIAHSRGNQMGLKVKSTLWSPRCSKPCNKYSEWVPNLKRGVRNGHRGKGGVGYWAQTERRSCTPNGGFLIGLYPISPRGDPFHSSLSHFLFTATVSHV